MPVKSKALMWRQSTTTGPLLSLLILLIFVLMKSIVGKRRPPDGCIATHSNVFCNKISFKNGALFLWCVKCRALERPAHRRVFNVAFRSGIDVQEVEEINGDPEQNPNLHALPQAEDERSEGRNEISTWKLYVHTCILHGRCYITPCDLRLVFHISRTSLTSTMNMTAQIITLERVALGMKKK